MPARQLTLLDFTWDSPPDPPPARAAAGRVPFAPPKPKKKKAKSRAGDHVVGPGTLAVLLDRVQAAIERGEIELCPDDIPCESLEFTLAELAKIQEILFREEFPRDAPPPRPTRTAPGSAARIAEYAARLGRGEALYAAGDARADGPGRGLRVTQRANGSGVKVLGWEDEDEAA